jgi:hypothetical protein
MKVAFYFIRLPSDKIRLLDLARDIIKQLNPITFSLNQQEPHTYPQGGVERNAKRRDDSSPRKIGLRSKEEIGLDEEMSKSGKRSQKSLKEAAHISRDVWREAHTYP